VIAHDTEPPTDADRPTLVAPMRFTEPFEFFEELHALIEPVTCEERLAPAEAHP
jgi:hypothetical protein